MSGLETRAARNVVIVATANKLARISWAVLASGNDYHPRHRVVAVSHQTKWFLNLCRRSLQKKEEDENTVKRRA
jgi:uncharacterized protein YfaS (alpha-2-macroglobulin family)